MYKIDFYNPEKSNHLKRSTASKRMIMDYHSKDPCRP